MPGDLLRFVSGPAAYSTTWLWVGLFLLAAVIAWHLAAFVWTLPSHLLRRIPVVRALHRPLIRRRYARTIRTITRAHRAGDLQSGQACAAMSRTLRSFLHQATGVRAQYLHVGAIAAGDLAAAAPLFAALGDARFNTAVRADIDELGSAAQELIRSWT